jgi:hypothetical protein
MEQGANFLNALLALSPASTESHFHLEGIIGRVPVRFHQYLTDSKYNLVTDWPLRLLPYQVFRGIA